MKVFCSSDHQRVERRGRLRRLGRIGRLGRLGRDDVDFEGISTEILFSSFELLGVMFLTHVRAMCFFWTYTSQNTARKVSKAYAYGYPGPPAFTVFVRRPNCRCSATDCPKKCGGFLSS